MLVSMFVCVLVLPAFAGKFSFREGGKISERGKIASGICGFVLWKLKPVSWWGFEIYPFCGMILWQGSQRVGLPEESRWRGRLIS